MTISQSIYDYIELSRLTKQPILLISNPGYGKTTSITNWAKENNYHYEQLIGSRFSPDDILGYQVNEPGSPTLIQKDPIWFQRIIDAKKENVSTILFVDEISTCSDTVQGSLLSLIFDRRIGNGKNLPNDCIIIAAANYSENLPSFMNIMAPTINRFCIVNLLMGFNNSEIIRECLTPQNPKLREVSKVDEKEIEKQFNEMINDIIIKYSQLDSSLGYIDLSNHDISDIYKRRGNVYNIISWRSITYFKNFVIAMAKLGISEPVVIRNICAGMIGLGSNSFKNDDQIESFISLVSDHVKQIIDANYAESSDFEFDPKSKICDLVNEYLTKLESTNTLGSSKVETSLVNIIDQKYGNYKNVYNDLKSGVLDGKEFIADMDAIGVLLSRVNSNNGEILANIHQSCSSMYNDLLGVKNNFDKEVYGIYMPTIIKRVILARDNNGKTSRLGVFGTNENSFVVIPDSALISRTALSKLIREDNFTRLTLDKIL